MGKVVEKVVTKQLFQYCEKYSKLQPGQRGGRKERSALDAVDTLVPILCTRKMEGERAICYAFYGYKGGV